jgi:glucokinase
MVTRREQSTTPPSPGEGVTVVADVGGTHARFAVVGSSPQDLRGIETLRCAEYPDIRHALADYQRRRRVGRVKELCVAVAGPVGDDRVDLPNSHWSFHIGALQRDVGAPLTVINDFTAQAMAIDALRPDEMVWLGTPRPGGGGARAIIGPGTGLGVAVQTVNGEVLPSEGGHVGFAPGNLHELDLLKSLLRRFQRVSTERLLSGPGLENLYWANRTLADADAARGDEACSAARVARLASEEDAVALQAVRDFFNILATFSGDVALLTMATGGVYLSGGVLQRLIGFLEIARFRTRFEEKGRLSGFCRTVPLAYVAHAHPGLLGCAAILRRAAPAVHFAQAAAPPVDRFPAPSP